MHVIHRDGKTLCGVARITDETLGGRGAPHTGHEQAQTPDRDRRTTARAAARDAMYSIEYTARYNVYLRADLFL